MSGLKLCNIHVDAFTNGPAACFTGNPAAVVVLHSAACPSSEWMLKLAKENNLSETAFLAPQGDSTWRIRWFTPGCEVDLCGHATLASAHALWHHGYVPEGQTVIQLHSASGTLTAVKDTSGRIELNFPAEPPSHCSAQEASELLPVLQSALGLLGAQVAGELALVLGTPGAGRARARSEDGEEATHPPQILFIGRNRHDVYVEVSASAFAALPAVPDMAIIQGIKSRGVVVTCAGGNAVLSASNEPEASDDQSTLGQYHFLSRWFGPQVGVDEDPVTGSAHCGLAPFWTAKLLAQAGGAVDPTSFPWLNARQASARGGELRVRLMPETSAGEGGRVLLQGWAVSVVEASLSAHAMPPSS